MLRRTVVGSAQQVLRSFKPKIQATKPKDTAKMIGDGVVVSCRCASSLFVRRSCASARCDRWLCILSLRLCTSAKELLPLFVVHTLLLNILCTKSREITDASYQLVTCVPCCFLPCAGWLAAQVRVNWNENLLEFSLSLAHFVALSLSWQIVAAVAAIAEILLRLRAKVHTLPLREQNISTASTILGMSR